MTEPSAVTVLQNPRVRAAGAFASIALALAALRGPAPGNDIGSLAHAIGAHVHGFVAPADVRWEPSGGLVSDLLVGRFALVLASDVEGGARDLYRVRVRVAPDGHPLQIVSMHDLTATPLGDDHALVLRGSHAAFATYAYGQEQSVTVLDLGGEGAQSSAETRLDKLTSALTNWQETGSLRGIARVEVDFEQPAERVGLRLDEQDLRIELGNGEGDRRASLDLVRGELRPPVPGLHAEPGRHLPKRFILWAVDTVRAVPWIGPRPIAWLEEKVFAAKDALKQTAFHLHGQDDTETLAAGAEVSAPRVLDTSGASLDDGAWPPANLASIWKTPEPGEGEWTPRKGAWMKKFPAPAGVAEAPPAFFETFVRPDDARPYAKVLLVAMDMRQLDLEMEAGTEDPKPLTGQHGPGRLPRDPAVLQRVTAAFNGAFKTEHGNYGMMVNKRVLLPPQPAAATVILTTDGRAGFGTWGKTADIGGLSGIPDADIVSFRQNLDPLIDLGVVNPMGRALWGYTLPGNGMQTERSGICVTGAGHMMYVWGDDVSATTLGKAMKMAGCVYGMHLDMNPHHTGFVYTSINQLKGHDYHSELLTSLMEISTDRYIEYAPKDFFYMLLRDPTPPALRADSSAAAASWVPDPGLQPAPAWSPGIWKTVAGDVTLWSVEPGRGTLALTAGTREPDARTGAAPSVELGDDQKKKVVLSVSSGVSPEHARRGLVTNGKHVLPITRDPGLAVLLLPHDDAPSILDASQTVTATPGVDAVELPLILDGGTPTETSRLPFLRGKLAAEEHAALGLAADGTLVFAKGSVASPSILAAALVRAGCTRAVLLDRGTEATSTVLRAGTEHPPVARGDETTLYVLAKPMKPRAFRFVSQ